MYEAFYGLNEEPFRLSSDYRFCYGHKSYSRAKAYMQYAFERAEGFVMITGQPGTGKTTLVNELTHTLDSEEPVKIAMLVTTQMDSSDLLRMVAYHFGLTDLGQSKSEVLQQLTNMLTQTHRSGGRALLIIDEAQGLIQREDQDLDYIFQQLQQTYSQLEEERLQAHQRHEEAKRIFEEAHAVREQLTTQTREERKRHRQQWQREFSKAQRQVAEVVETLKKEKRSSGVQATRRTLGSIDQRITNLVPVVEVPSLCVPKAGDLVELDDFGTTGILQDDPDGRKQVSILVGSQTIKISPSAIHVVSSSSRAKTKSKIDSRQVSTGSSFTSSNSSMKTGFYQQEHDLRGVRLEAALDRTTAALDQALIDQAKYVKIIHGQGSGALKAGIRELCQSSPYTKNYRAGDRSEGRRIH